MKTALVAPLLSCCYGQTAAVGLAVHTAPKIEIYFSPAGGCTDAVVREIDAAKARFLSKLIRSLQSRLPKHWWKPTSEA